jgi:glucose/arabinose dehydrogenase
MVGLYWIPGEPAAAVVLTQQAGIVYRADLSDPGADPTVFLDLSEELIDNPGNEEGLLGLAFSPDYETTGRFYVYYSVGDPRRTVVERYVATGEAADEGSAERLLEVDDPYANHNGGAIVFGPDGMLYVGIGDGGSGGDPQGNGQNANVLLGKVLRLDVSGEGAYASPPDNPFASGGGAPEVWAYGLRNPWRITFDRETGDLWAGDVGQGSFEEVNRIERGGNYGWSIMEGPECFREDDCDQTGLTLPRAWYGRDDGVSVTGGYVYRGAALPELDGWYVYGDFGSGNVWALDTANDDTTPIRLMESGENIASFAEDPDGELYLVTFGGGIRRVVRQ